MIGAIRHAVAILTFVPAKAPPSTRLRLRSALSSLERSGYDGSVFVVDDGSNDAAHLASLDRISTDVRVIKRPGNGGISRAKNTCLRVLSEAQVDIGFIAEDDIAFSRGWADEYVFAHKATSIHHFSWAWDDDPSGEMRKELQHVGGYPVVKTSRVNGVLLTFTPQVVEKVGGFAIAPCAWGHEHTHWTRRIVQAQLSPCFADIVDSNRYIGLNEHASSTAVRDDTRAVSAATNEEFLSRATDIYCPIIE